jgi:anti-sigma factor RsiW
MTCAQFGEVLSGYVDDELLLNEREQAEAHLAACGSCREQAASARSLKHAIARLPDREEPPGAVRARVEALRFGRAGSFSARRAAELLGVALLAVAIAATVAIRGARPTGARLAEELVSDHLRWLADPAPAQVASADPRQVARFFEGRVPFTPIAPRLPDARLIGGRLCKIEGRRAQLLFYRCERQAVSLFIMDLDLGGGRCLESRGRAVCSRRFGDLTVLAVGEVPGRALEQLLREATL